MISAILGAVLTTTAKDAVGRIKKKARVSATKASADGALGVGLWAILPGVFEKDPQAIGQLVLLLISWAGVLWGRWRADKAEA